MQCDIWEFLESNNYKCPNGEAWDIAIFFPVCTFVCGSGWHRTKDNPERLAKADFWIENTKRLLSLPIKRIALENPIGVLSSRVREPDQIIQPYQFDEDASKATCLWLKNLPKLRPTGFAAPRRVGDGDANLFGEAGTPRWGNQTDSGQNKLAPSASREAERGKTYQGIANAMASQWGTLEAAYQMV